MSKFMVTYVAEVELMQLTTKARPVFGPVIACENSEFVVPEAGSEDRTISCPPVGPKPEARTKLPVLTCAKPH